MEEKSGKKKIKIGIAFRSIVGLVTILMIFALTVSLIGYRSFTDALLEQYADGAFQTADAAAFLIEPERVVALVNSRGTTAEYEVVWEDLTELTNRTGATFIYVIMPDRTDYGKIGFLFSTVNKDTDYTPYEFGYVRDTTNDEYKEKYRAILEGGSEQEYVVRGKGLDPADAHITAMVPVKREDGTPMAILCVERPMERLNQSRNDYLRGILWTFVLVVALVVLVLSLYLHFMLLKPIRSITGEARRFADENIPAAHQLSEKIRSRDEIGTLASSLDEMETQIHDYIEHVQQITAENERYTTELDLAKGIQAGVLPDKFPAFPERGEFDIYASMEAAKEVGGDFYDFFLIDDDHLCLEIADVSGKGIPAALFMMSVKNMLANNAALFRSPAKILEYTNNSVCANNPEEMFVTVWLGVLEISTRTLVAANAGHEYPMIRKPGGEFVLMKDKHDFVIGGFEDMIYSEYEVQLEPGSAVFVYTDGVAEAMDGSRNMFGVERTLATLNASPDASPEALIRNVRSAVNGFVRDAEQFDDMTMLCLEIK